MNHVGSLQRYRFQDCFNHASYDISNKNILMYGYQKANFTVHRRGKPVNHWLYWYSYNWHSKTQILNDSIDSHVKP